ncbi:unnamed protein product [Brassica rapa subsp. narinosa]
MSGMGDGYVGTSQDGVRIRRLQKQREAERRKIQELKSKTASGQEQSGLLQFGSSSCEILDTAFKKETVGLVTREEYVEKRVNIRNKFEEEEKEKLQKLLQEEEELQQQKRNKKRKIKGSSRLSFAEDLDDDSDADDGENTNLRFGKLGKDPSVETNFLPDSEREAEEQAERERLKKQWTREQEQIKNEPLQITYSYWDGTGHRRVRKGDAIGNFLRAVQQQLAPDFREIRTTSVENLLYVKEDLIIPHCMGATSLERRCEIAVAILSERPHRSDVVKSLWLSSQSDLIGAISVPTLMRRSRDVAPSWSDFVCSLQDLAPRRFFLIRRQKRERPRSLTSEPTRSGTQRTVHQQTLAARKSQEQEKRAGKSVAVPTHEESETESGDEQTPTKKAKMSKGKAVAVDWDRAKTPSVEELYDHLMNGQHSFYELIINKARGKSGPLFHFDVHEDVRTIADATIEKDESHAGKVVERHWYEKNKHIFPASRWEIYDPAKKWERYTVHGD